MAHVFKIVVAVALFPFAFLGDFLIFFATKTDCFECGWGDIIKKGAFCRALLKEFHSK